MCVLVFLLGPGLVTCILCFVYFLVVIVWLSVPVQSIAWKDSSPK